MSTETNAAEIDRLYQGPLEAFIDARNALAKSLRRADLKALTKPNVPAWAVNQLFWHHRSVIDGLSDAAGALRTQHQQMLAGDAADVRQAESAHREAVRHAVAVVKDILTAAGHPLTAATLDAVRETLQALPSPEANGRLVRALTPRGLEALAGMTVATRPGPVGVVRAEAGPGVVATQASAAAAGTAAAPTPVAAKDRQQQARDRERAARDAERAARERDAQRKRAESALAAARGALTRADDAVAAAEQALAARQAERLAARQQVARAQRLVEELSFGR